MPFVLPIWVANATLDNLVIRDRLNYENIKDFPFKG
tara:strand:- start:334 stop:441 length:108 start_codon:yes stop_codon:yes gene_type:complete